MITMNELNKKLIFDCGGRINIYAGIKEINKK